MITLKSNTKSLTTGARRHVCFFVETMLFFASCMAYREHLVGIYLLLHINNTLNTCM